MEQSERTDSTSNDLHVWGWKQRSGILGLSSTSYLTGLLMGATSSRGGGGAPGGVLVAQKWEYRSIVVSGVWLKYYQTGQEDAAQPRGVLDLVENKVTAQVMIPPADAPSQLGCTIQSDVLKLQWNFCFDAQDDLMAFLDAIHRVLEKGGAYLQKDKERFEHEFQEADHIFRWEIIFCPPVIYPIQIHGIVLSAGRNCVVVADFGLTGYGRKAGADFNHEEDHRANAILAAWKKLRPEQDQRLTIVTLIDPMEIRKWTKARYDEESLFHGAETFKKLINKVNKLTTTTTTTTSASTNHNHNNNDIKHRQDGAKRGPETQPDTGEHHEEQVESRPRQSQLSKSEHSCSTATAPSSSSSSPDDPDHELPQSDPKEIVLARANFLLENMDALPPYHVFFSNSECIAVWCKTGRWSTLQTAVFLSTNSVGAAKSSIIATMGVAAAHALLAPVVAIGGLLWVTAPMVILKKSREKWEETTRIMTDLFWAQAPPAVFVAAIENWGLSWRRQERKRQQQQQEENNDGSSRSG